MALAPGRLRTAASGALGELARAGREGRMTLQLIESATSALYKRQARR